MTQIDDQQQMDATRRVAAKLQAFHEGLAEEEQWALDLAVRRLVAREGAADTQGHMINHYDVAPRPRPQIEAKGAGLIIPTLFNDMYVTSGGSPIAPVNLPG